MRRQIIMDISGRPLHTHTARSTGQSDLPHPTQHHPTRLPPLVHSAPPDAAMPFFFVRFDLSVAEGVVLMDSRVIVPRALRCEVLRDLHIAHMLSLIHI